MLDDLDPGARHTRMIGEHTGAECEPELLDLAVALLASGRVHKVLERLARQQGSGTPSRNASEKSPSNRHETLRSRGL